jgi:hypothetical protein
MEGEVGWTEDVFIPVEAFQSIMFNNDKAGLQKSDSLAFIREDFLPSRGDLVEGAHHQIA